MHAHTGTQREADSWHPKSGGQMIQVEQKMCDAAGGFGSGRWGGAESSQSTHFFGCFPKLKLNNTHAPSLSHRHTPYCLYCRAVFTSSLCRNPTDENLLSATVLLMLHFIELPAALCFPVNIHPLKTLFHHLTLLHIWIVLLQSYSLWLSNILQDQMERDGEMNGGRGCVREG